MRVATRDLHHRAALGKDRPRSKIKLVRLAILLLFYFMLEISIYATKSIYPKRDFPGYTIQCQSATQTTRHLLQVDRPLYQPTWSIEVNPDTLESKVARFQSTSFPLQHCVTLDYVLLQ